MQRSYLETFKVSSKNKNSSKKRPPSKRNETRQSENHQLLEEPCLEAHFSRQDRSLNTKLESSSHQLDKERMTSKMMPFKKRLRKKSCSSSSPRRKSSLQSSCQDLSKDSSSSSPLSPSFLSRGDYRIKNETANDSNESNNASKSTTTLMNQI